MRVKDFYELLVFSSAKSNLASSINPYTVVRTVRKEPLNV
jgi:hypothetical protein